MVVADCCYESERSANRGQKKGKALATTKLLKYDVTTVDGGRIVIESDAPSPEVVVDNARSSGILSGTEVFLSTGRRGGPDDPRVAIPYHAIVAVRVRS